MNGNDTPPTDSEVREAYANIQDQEGGEEWTSAKLEAEFDAWLASVRANAWDEGWKHAGKVFSSTGTGPRARNPYRT